MVESINSCFDSFFYSLLKLILTKLITSDRRKLNQPWSHQMDILNLIISLVSGAVGGNVAGVATPEKNLGPLINTVVGLLGGGVGDFILKALGVLATTGATAAATTTGDAGLDLTAILANIGVSGVSGGALTAIVALLKNAMDKK